MEFFQLFVKSLDNKTLTLQFPKDTTTSLQSIKQQIKSLTEIPIHIQKLTLNGKFINDTTPITPSFSLSTLHLNIPLLGGKGGFGSLLRGAGTKAGQKKTNNFDACRDMSGRRLRHVNAEKKLEEWKAEGEERKLEKAAEDYLKKMMKEKKKSGGGDGAEKYVQKYREQSARCVEEVERSVRESLGKHIGGGKKRKLSEKLEKKAKAEGADAKKLKIWMGKRIMGDSDSNDTDDESDKDYAEVETSTVIDNGNNSDSNKDSDGSSGSESVEQLDRVRGSPESGSQEDKEAVPRGSIEPTRGLSGSNVRPEGNGISDLLSESEEQKMDQDKEFGSGSESESQGNESKRVQVASATTPFTPAVAEVDGVIEVQPVINDVKSEVDETNPVVENPLSLDEFSTATELQVLGLERLKSELQTRGLKCGGTLQERAARLFLLKTTPIDKLPKKLFAKK